MHTAFTFLFLSRRFFFFPHPPLPISAYVSLQLVFSTFTLLGSNQLYLSLPCSICCLTLQYFPFSSLFSLLSPFSNLFFHFSLPFAFFYLYLTVLYPGLLDLSLPIMKLLFSVLSPPFHLFLYSSALYSSAPLLLSISTPLLVYCTLLYFYSSLYITLSNSITPLSQ